LQKAGNIKQMNRALIARGDGRDDDEGEDRRRIRAAVSRSFAANRLLCFTCHAIGDGGGLLGPNIVSLGSAAPVTTSSSPSWSHRRRLKRATTDHGEHEAKSASHGAASRFNPNRSCAIMPPIGSFMFHHGHL